LYFEPDTQALCRDTQGLSFDEGKRERAKAPYDEAGVDNSVLCAEAVADDTRGCAEVTVWENTQVPAEAAEPGESR